jgi:hypothetical protein
VTIRHRVRERHLAALATGVQSIWESFMKENRGAKPTRPAREQADNRPARYIAEGEVDSREYAVGAHLVSAGGEPVHACGCDDRLATCTRCGAPYNSMRGPHNIDLCQGARVGHVSPIYDGSPVPSPGCVEKRETKGKQLPDRVWRGEKPYCYCGNEMEGAKICASPVTYPRVDDALLFAPVYEGQTDITADISRRCRIHNRDGKNRTLFCGCVSHVVFVTLPSSDGSQVRVCVDPHVPLCCLFSWLWGTDVIRTHLFCNKEGWGLAYTTILRDVIEVCGHDMPVLVGARDAVGRGRGAGRGHAPRGQRGGRGGAQPPAPQGGAPAPHGGRGEERQAAGAHGGAGQGGKGGVRGGHVVMAQAAVAELQYAQGQIDGLRQVVAEAQAANEVPIPEEPAVTYERELAKWKQEHGIPDDAAYWAYTGQGMRAAHAVGYIPWEIPDVAVAAPVWNGAIGDFVVGRGCLPGQLNEKAVVSEMMGRVTFERKRQAIPVGMPATLAVMLFLCVFAWCDGLVFLEMLLMLLARPVSFFVRLVSPGTIGGALALMASLWLLEVIIEVLQPVLVNSGIDVGDTRLYVVRARRFVCGVAMRMVPRFGVRTVCTDIAKLVARVAHVMRPLSENDISDVWRTIRPVNQVAGPKNGPGETVVHDPQIWEVTQTYYVTYSVMGLEVRLPVSYAGEYCRVHYVSAQLLTHALNQAVMTAPSLELAKLRIGRICGTQGEVHVSRHEILRSDVAGSTHDCAVAFWESARLARPRLGF